MNRYRSDKRIKGGKTLATNQSVNRIKNAVRNKTLKVRRYTTKEGDRLDKLAGKFLGDGRLWWVLAACSKIGWGLQVPAGTLIFIPQQIEKLNALL
jgi:nucleoid-associated protein YgaU